MEYFNERFRQIKNSDLPAIPGPNGNVGLKCFTQPFNNFLDPAGSFNFYPNFNYTRFFENDMRSCRHSTNYLPTPPVHTTSNIKQTASPFCYHSGMTSPLYQNCYQNGDPKSPHHANFFYPPNFYPQAHPSRLTPPSGEFGENSKVNQSVGSARQNHINNHESSGRTSANANSNASPTSAITTRNCSYIPHRPYQNSESFFQNCLWSSLSSTNLPKYPEKVPSVSENQTNKGNPAGDKMQSPNGGHPADGATFESGSKIRINQNASLHGPHKQHAKAALASHKKSNCPSALQFNRSTMMINETASTNRDFSGASNGIQTAEADSQSNVDKDKMTATRSPLSGIGHQFDLKGIHYDEALAKETPIYPPTSLSSPLTFPHLPLPATSSGVVRQKQPYTQFEAKFTMIKCPLCGTQLESNDHLDLHLRSHVDSLPPADLSVLTGPKVKGKKKAAKKEPKKDGTTKDGEGDESKNKILCRCTTCPKGFTRLDKLKQHISKRHPELLSSFYKCPHCEQGFEKSVALRKHFLENHPGLYPQPKVKQHRHKQPHYSCDKCGEQLASKRDLIYHVMGHSGATPLSCRQCGSKFTRPDKLKRHMLIHTGELPFTCFRCGQGFSRTDRLKEHTVLVHKERLLKCPSCDKDFDTWLQLKHHLKTHEYTCKECGESFTRKRRLLFHVMAHRSDKLLRCSECGIRFGHPSRLKKHIDFVHNSKVPLGRISCIAEAVPPSDALVSGDKVSSDDLGKVKVEPGTQEKDEEEIKVESWSQRLRKVEDLKKPKDTYYYNSNNNSNNNNNKGVDNIERDYDDFDDGGDELEDEGDDGSYEYDCRRGLSGKRMKKRKHKSHRKSKAQPLNKKMKKNDGEPTKVKTMRMIKSDKNDDGDYATSYNNNNNNNNSIMTNLSSNNTYSMSAFSAGDISNTIKKDNDASDDCSGDVSQRINDAGLPRRNDENNKDESNENLNNNNNNNNNGSNKNGGGEDEDYDTDVERENSEISTMFCSICYLGFKNSDQLINHSQEHLSNCNSYHANDNNNFVGGNNPLEKVYTDTTRMEDTGGKKDVDKDNCGNDVQNVGNNHDAVN